MNYLLRPAWLWNTRVPFHTFVVGHKRINRIFAALTLAMEASSYYVRMPSNSHRSVRAILHVNKGTARAMRAWPQYERSNALPGETRDPTTSPELFLNAMAESEAFIETSTLVMYATHFEHYVLSWSLNALLARLEGSIPLTKGQVDLAEAFNSDSHSLGVPLALRAFPDVSAELAKLPHVFTDARTGKPVEEPIDPFLNARDAVLFWRSYRNAVIHNGGLVTSEFELKHSPLWERLRRPYGTRLGSMIIGRRLEVSDGAVRAQFTVHYRVALWLNEFLLKISGARRGHLDAPEPIREGSLLEVPEPPCLLLAGDHEPSLARAR